MGCLNFKDFHIKLQNVCTITNFFDQLFIKAKKSMVIK